MFVKIIEENIYYLINASNIIHETNKILEREGKKVFFGKTGVPMG